MKFYIVSILEGFVDDLLLLQLDEMFKGSFEWHLVEKYSFIPSSS